VLEVDFGVFYFNVTRQLIREVLCHDDHALLVVSSLKIFVILVGEEPRIQRDNSFSLRALSSGAQCRAPTKRLTHNNQVFKLYVFPILAKLGEPSRRHDFVNHSEHLLLPDLNLFISVLVII